jgi:hypothetical protein
MVVSMGDSTSAGWRPISTNGKLVTTYDTVSQAGVAIKGKLCSDVHEFIVGGADEKVLQERADRARNSARRWRQLRALATGDQVRMSWWGARLQRRAGESACAAQG